MGERSWAYRLVREALSLRDDTAVVRLYYVETCSDGSRRRFPGDLWADTAPGFARLLGDVAEALTRPVLVERDGRLEEETP